MSAIVYKSTDDIPLTFGPKLLCDILNISKNTAYSITRNPSFPKTRIGNRIIISKTQFIKWLESTEQ
jgi:hypothetical protein